ncbi:HD domain-containing protein [Proteinivorax hydrogeniformans]|uniref:HD domain-containing protein n=1 Tax=Proteinivorax hydrogeniformans TaxID=1826727 RepID=A0AAU8HT40_9FIRM
MKIKRSKAIAYNYLKDIKYKERETGYLYYHGLRVANLSLNLANMLGDLSNNTKERMYIAAIFHDVAKGREPHNLTGAIKTKNLLKQVLSQQEINEIARLIYYHNRRGNDNLHLETKILQDADIIDHTGTLDVWLGMHYVVDEDLSPKQALKFFLGGSWHQMVVQQRAKLNFPLSKRVYDKRVYYAEKFFKKMAWEMKGKL